MAVRKGRAGQFVLAMATLYKFDCESCGYNAEVSGGEDCGMAAATTTIACETCRKLYDVVVQRTRDDAQA